MRILIFTTDIPPLPGSPTSGTALRTFNLAEGLKESGHEVIISPPRSAMDGYSLPEVFPKNAGQADKELATHVAGLKKRAFDIATQEARIQEINPDVIICGHWPAWTLGRKPRQPLVIDLAGPHLLERHFQGEDDFQGAVHGKLNVLSSADYFIVSGNKQKLYFLSFLLKANIPEPEKRICTIPMPLPSLPDETSHYLEKKESVKTLNTRCNKEEFPKFIFGGVFLPWQDPSKGLKILSDELQKRKKGSLLLVGGPHPHYKIKSGTYDALFSSLEHNPHVSRKPLLPYEEFLSKLPGIDVALDLMAWNLERELAITIRTTTYLWSGIPIIYNDFADLSSYIKEYDAGWCVDPQKPEELLRVINEIYENPSIIKEKSENALRLAKEVFDRRIAAGRILSILETPQVPLKEHYDIQMDLPELCEYSLSPEIPLSQYFSCRMNGLKEISLLFGTHDSVCDGELEFNIYEKNSSSGKHPEKIHSLKKDAKEIKNNEWMTLEIDPIENSAGKEFCLEIVKHTTGEDSLSPWMMKSSPYPMQGLFEGEHTQRKKKLGVNSLCLRTKCLRPDTNQVNATDA